MNLDLRLPIGLMFTIVGAMLVLYGLVSDAAIYARSLDINVNLWWGLVLLAFGVTMPTFALRATRRPTPPAPPPSPTHPPTPQP